MKLRAILLVPFFLIMTGCQAPMPKYDVSNLSRLTEQLARETVPAGKAFYSAQCFQKARLHSHPYFSELDFFDQLRHFENKGNYGKIRNSVIQIRFRFISSERRHLEMCNCIADKTWTLLTYDAAKALNNLVLGQELTEKEVISIADQSFPQNFFKIRSSKSPLFRCVAEPLQISRKLAYVLDEFAKLEETSAR